MSIATAAVLASTPLRDTASPRNRGLVLVCATGAVPDEPQVVLADGAYETTDERVFWRNQPTCEVLRLPLAAPVATRPVRHFDTPPASAPGELALLEAVRASRRKGQLAGSWASGSANVTSRLR
ncbi:MAG: hypothetical protein JWM02_2584 [Frankiales bacterium]|nr:hypothetical protein [Frankiales bacterium]